MIARTDTHTWWSDVEANLTPKKGAPRPAPVPNLLVSRRSLPAPSLPPKQQTIKNFFVRQTKSVTESVTTKNEEDDLVSYYFKREDEDDFEIKPVVKKSVSVSVGVKKDEGFVEVKKSVDFASEAVVSTVTRPKVGLEAFSALEKFTTNARLRRTEIDPTAPKVSLRIGDKFL